MARVSTVGASRGTARAGGEYSGCERGRGKEWNGAVIQNIITGQKPSRGAYLVLVMEVAGRDGYSA